MIHVEASSPTFTIIVAVLNGAQTIEDCVGSLRGETTSGWELVVIDGGSGDGTQEALRRNQEAIAYWESSRDRGICHAWNKALGHSKGDWILFLGADDILASPEVLERVHAAIADAGESRVAYGHVDIVGPDGAVERLGRPWAEARKGYFDHNTLPHQGVFHHRTLFNVNGGFDEEFRICGDYELLLRELRTRDRTSLAAS